MTPSLAGAAGAGERVGVVVLSTSASTVPSMVTVYGRTPDLQTSIYFTSVTTSIEGPGTYTSTVPSVITIYERAPSPQTPSDPTPAAPHISGPGSYLPPPTTTPLSTGKIAVGIAVAVFVLLVIVPCF